MNFDYSDFIKLLPVPAIVLSILALVINIRNSKRQIRIGKLEEVLELVNFVSNTYYHLQRVFLLQSKMYDEVHFADDNTLEAYDKNIQIRKSFIFTHITTKENYINKCERLEILAKCYVNDSRLSIKLIVYVEFMKSLLHDVLTDGLHPESNVTFLPSHFNHQKYIYKIERELIKEMDLKSKAITRLMIKEYRDNKFKSDFK